MKESEDGKEGTERRWRVSPKGNKLPFVPPVISDGTLVVTRRLFGTKTGLRRTISSVLD